jgi:hypothetical protein
MATAPQNVLDLLNSLLQAYPAGLPQGIHLNINLDVKVEDEIDDTPGSTPVGPVYKGPFLGLYRVVANNESKRIKVRSDSDALAPEISIPITTRHVNFMQALNPTKPTYLESNGYIYTTTGAVPKIFYRQFAFDGQLIVIAETKRSGKTAMGRIVGIGSDPLLSDPKPFDATLTNNTLTPWLVHQIPGLLVYAPILSADTAAGWVCMDELEKIR